MLQIRKDAQRAPFLNLGACRNELGTLNIIDDVCSMWEVAFAA